MAKRMIFRSVEIGFPPACVVCQAPATTDYKVSRTFTFGNHSMTITLPVPMCATHHVMATSKSPVEKAIERAGLVLGAMLGVAAAFALYSMWASTGQGGGILNILMAFVVFAMVVVLLWATAAFAIAPLFAAAEVKAARQAVKIYHFWPGSKELQLEFANDQIADRIARANAGRIAQAS